MTCSIIIPTYNAGSTLHACLQSIFIQTFTDYEVIIIDSVSEDDTKNIFTSFREAGLNVRYVSERDNGIYDAMNKGITLATGEWLYFMGSDDCLADQHVLANVSKSVEGDCQIVYGDVVLLPGGQVESGLWDHRQMLHMTINHQRIFYKACLFAEYGAFNVDYKIAADYDLNIRLFVNKDIVKKYINVTIACYNLNGYSASKVDETFWNNFKKVIVHPLNSFLSKKEIYGRLRFYCWYLIQQNKFRRAREVGLQILFHTRSLEFIKHTVSQWSKQMRRS